MGRVGRLLDLSRSGSTASETQWPSASRHPDPSPERPLLTTFHGLLCPVLHHSSRPLQILTFPRTIPFYLPFPSEFNSVQQDRAKGILHASQKAGKNVAKQKNHRLFDSDPTPAAERTMARLLLMETPWAQQQPMDEELPDELTWGLGTGKCSKLSSISTHPPQ